jgi:hypothetical protein
MKNQNKLEKTAENKYLLELTTGKTMKDFEFLFIPGGTIQTYRKMHKKNKQDTKKLENIKIKTKEEEAILKKSRKFNGQKTKLYVGATILDLLKIGFYSEILYFGYQICNYFTK